jgi:hypothetical protein
MAANKIEILGLRDLQRELRAADKAFPKELRAANKDAAEIVADATRASFASRGGVAPKVAASVKALAQQRSASVKIGGARFPYALGSEFGGGARPRTRQFPRFKKGGYSLFPAIKDNREKVVDAYADAIDKLTRRAFPG